VEEQVLRELAGEQQHSWELVLGEREQARAQKVKSQVNEEQSPSLVEAVPVDGFSGLATQPWVQGQEVEQWW
jgi:hypothetical protein